MIAAHRTGTYFATLALASGLTLLAADIAEARRGGSFGSRGGRTFQMPAPTRTAPTQTAPVERSTTTAPAPSATGQQAARPGAATAPRPGLFGQGFGGTLMRGLLIGGLIGMLFGGGLGGLAGLLGLVFQLALIGLGVMLVMRFLASRRQPMPAAAGAGAGVQPRLPTDILRSAEASPGGGPAAAPARRLSANDEIGLGQSDLDSFERRLSEVQAAYSAEDMGALRRITTPEIMSYLAEELHDNAARGLRNEVRGVRLLQGDLAEAWREAGEDFATVAMRFESADALVDRSSGRVVEGDLDSVSEATELWTFVRRPGEEWRLSAIQEAAPAAA